MHLWPNDDENIHVLVCVPVGHPGMSPGMSPGMGPMQRMNPPGRMPGPMNPVSSISYLRQPPDRFNLKSFIWFGCYVYTLLYIIEHGRNEGCSAHIDGSRIPTLSLTCMYISYCHVLLRNHSYPALSVLYPSLQHDREGVLGSDKKHSHFVLKCCTETLNSPDIHTCAQRKY